MTLHVYVLVEEMETDTCFLHVIEWQRELVCWRDTSDVYVYVLVKEETVLTQVLVYR